MSFLEIFAPGLRHLREERERQRHDVAHPRVAGPPLGIDLDAGTARIVVPAPAPDPASDPTPDPDPDHTSDSDLDPVRIEDRATHAPDPAAAGESTD